MAETDDRLADFYRQVLLYGSHGATASQAGARMAELTRRALVDGVLSPADLGWERYLAVRPRPDIATAWVPRREVR